MNNRIVRIRDGRVYYCAACPYRDTLTGFCGFCMRKVLDEAAVKKVSASDDDDEPPLAEPENER